jgi:hypothetical protein
MKPNYESVDRASSQEAIRILSPANSRAMMHRRWEFVCELFEAGHSYTEIGKIIQRAPTTASRLHTYGRKARMGYLDSKARRGKGIKGGCIQCVFYKKNHKHFVRGRPVCDRGHFATEPTASCSLYTPKFSRPPTCLPGNKTEIRS